MARIDEYLLSQDATFQKRAISSIIDYVIGTIYTECPYDLQTVSVSGTPTGGTFTLTGGPLGSNTVTLPYNATPAQVQVAINQALSVPPGPSCVCLGSGLATGVMIVWTGTLSQQPQAVMTPNGGGLTGGSSPAVTVAHTVVGVANTGHPLRSALANKIIAAPASYMPILAQLLASNATIQSDYLSGQSSGSGVSAQVTDAHIDAAVASQFSLWAGAY